MYQLFFFFKAWQSNSSFTFIKGIVHPKIKKIGLSSYPQGIRDVGGFVSSVKHKKKIFNSNRCSLSVIEWQSMGPTALRDKKTYTDKTKWNPATRDDMLRSQDMKKLVCVRNWTVFISFFTSDPPQYPTVLSVFITFGAMCSGIVDASAEAICRVYVTHCLDRFCIYLVFWGTLVKQIVYRIQFWKS